MRLTLAAALALLPALAIAKPLPRYGTFIYSSLCWEKESGDASGARFMLTRSRQGDTLVYEYGNGPLEGARIKSLKVYGNRFEAEASTDDGELGLAAALEARRAQLSILFDYRKDGPPDVRILKRIKRFKQKILECR